MSLFDNLDLKVLMSLLDYPKGDDWKAFRYIAEMFRHSYVTATGIIHGSESLLAFANDVNAAKGVESQEDLCRDSAMMGLITEREYVQKMTSATLIAEAKQKLERTYKRFKEKRYDSFSIPAMVTPIFFSNEMKRFGMTERDCVIHNLCSGLLACGARFGFRDQYMEDEDWLEAIETAIILHYPEELLDPEIKSYAIHIPELLPEIRLFAVLIHTARGYERLSNECLINEDKAKDYDALYESYMELMDCHEALLGKYEQLKRNTEQGDELAKYRAEAERQNHLDSKRIFALERKVEQLTREKEHIAQLWMDEIAAIEAQRRLEKEGPQPDTVEELNAAMDDEALYGDVELPKKNVMFLGGWPQLLVPLKKKHPDWLFVNKHEWHPGTERIDVVFFFYECISHKLVWRIYSKLRPDVKTVFVRQRNEALMELEMKKGYAKVINAGSQKVEPASSKD